MNRWSSSHRQTTVQTHPLVRRTNTPKIYTPFPTFNTPTRILRSSSYVQAHGLLVTKSINLKDRTTVIHQHNTPYTVTRHSPATNRHHTNANRQRSNGNTTHPGVLLGVNKSRPGRAIHPQQVRQQSKRRVVLSNGTKKNQQMNASSTKTPSSTQFTNYVEKKTKEQNYHAMFNHGRRITTLQHNQPSSPKPSPPPPMPPSSSSSFSSSVSMHKNMQMKMLLGFFININ